MLLEEVLQVFESMPYQEVSQPFGPHDYVYKVGAKIFGHLVPGTFPPSINLKGNPEEVADLKAQHPETVTHAPYCNKVHWMRIYLDGALSVSEVRSLIETSYQLVVDGLTKKVRAELGEPAKA